MAYHARNPQVTDQIPRTKIENTYKYSKCATAYLSIVPGQFPTMG
jgi:hypothetical protein